MCLILVISILLVAGVYSEIQFIDPFTMDEDIVSKPYSNCPTRISSGRSEIPYEMHYRRTIALIVNFLKYNTGENTYNSRFNLELNEEEYNFLRKFLKDELKPSKDLLNDVDYIISNMFKSQGSFIDSFLTWKDYFYFTLYSWEVIICVGIALPAIFLVNIYRSRRQLRARPFILAALLLIWIVDFAIIYIKELKEKELEKMLYLAYTAPPECDVSKMSWLQYFISTFSGEDCKQYHKIKNWDVFTLVSPLQILSLQLGNIFVRLAEKIGESFSKINKALWENTTWMTLLPTVIVSPFILFFFLKMFGLTLSAICGRSFEMSFFGLFKSKMGDATPRIEENVIITNTIADEEIEPRKIIYIKNKSLENKKNTARSYIEDVIEGEEEEMKKQDTNEDTNLGKSEKDAIEEEEKQRIEMESNPDSQ